MFIHEDVIRGHHVYNEVWTTVCGEILEVTKEGDNVHDRRAVAVLRSRGSENICVGQVPGELSRTFWHFLSHSGEIMCEVTGRKTWQRTRNSLCIQVPRTREVDIKDEGAHYY